MRDPTKSQSSEKEPHPVSVEQNKALARRFVEEGLVNPDVLGEIVADDYVESGQQRGLETLKEHIAKNLVGLPDWHFVIEDLIAEGDKVVVCWRASATHTGEWWGIPPTGKEVAWRGMSRLRIADGKIAEQQVCWNAFWFHEQIGTIPSWDEIVKQAQSKQT